MKIIMAEHAGFCFGVNRAVSCVYDLIDKDKKIYTYGPIIHNDEVVKDLENHGVTVLDSLENLNELEKGTVVIRAHGVPESVYSKLVDSKMEIIDETCPFVKRIHNIVSEYSEKGYKIIIVGASEHPEVIGIKGWAKDAAVVVENIEEAQKITIDKDIDVCIVAQTTYNLKKFQEIVEIIQNKAYNVNVVNTICNATKERQESADKIASLVDVMIVIGSSTSSNTRKLYDICKLKCERTYLIQTVDDLDFDFFKSASLVGITAGASTPNKIIEEVQDYVRINF